MSRYTCAWCEEEIDTLEDEWYAFARHDGESRETVARFHGDPLPCWSEARDYGWS